MSDSVLNCPVASLYPDRYSMSRSKVYECIKALAITPFKIERRSFITLDELEALDEYIHLLNAEQSKAAEDFALSYQQRSHAKPDAEAVVIAPTIPPSFALLAQEIAAAMKPLPAPEDPLAPQKALQEAMSHSWYLKTSQLRALRITPKDGIILYGFKFRRVRRGWWRVEPGN